MNKNSIGNFKIDKSDWAKVKLGDVVFEPKESVKDPVAEGVEHVVGLEHIDSEDIHLRRFASIEESTTFTKKFAKGDVLFGRRRAYLKKAAYADFEGICSGDITVLRANKGLLPELLPFIVNNDKFFDYAITHSAGGLSPRVKFKDIANYEIILPPPVLQNQLAELLVSSDVVAVLASAADLSMKRLFVVEREDLNYFHGNDQHLKYHSKLKVDVNPSLKFRELGLTLLSIKYGTSKKANTENKGYGVLGIPNVVNEKVSTDNLAYVELSDKEYSASKLERGDIVIVRTNGNPAYTGRSALYDSDDGHVFASYLIKISVDENEYDQEYLIRYLQTNTIRRYFKRHATTSAGNYNINTETIKSVPVPIIPLEKQREIVQRLKLIECSMADSERYMDRSVSLLKGLIGKVF